MKRALLLFALAGGISLGSLKADVVSLLIPAATLTLDSGSPSADGSDWDWTYTLTALNGILPEIQSVEIFDIGGVVNVSAPNGWSASDTAVGGGGYDVTFEQNQGLLVIQPSNSSIDTIDGFTIESTTNVAESANYSVTFGNNTFDPQVGGPSANGAVPEPASITLLALVALGIGGGLRRKLR